jgi:hypothetical protein
LKKLRIFPDTTKVKLSWRPEGKTYDRNKQNQNSLRKAMKRSIALLGAFACTMLTSDLILAAEKAVPGQADFGSFTAPTGGGEFVEVNVPGGLISLAARFVEKAGTGRCETSERD